MVALTETPPELFPGIKWELDWESDWVCNVAGIVCCIQVPGSGSMSSSINPTVSMQNIDIKLKSKLKSVDEAAQILRDVITAHTKELMKVIGL